MADDDRSADTPDGTTPGPVPPSFAPPPSGGVPGAAEPPPPPAFGGGTPPPPPPGGPGIPPTGVPGTPPPPPPPPGGGFGAPPPPPPGQCGPPPGYVGGAPAGPKNDGMAIASLSTGIASIPFVFCCGLGLVLGVLGVVFGIIARKRIAASNGMLTGNGMALAGLICGAVGIGLGVIALVVQFTGLPVDTSSN